jgi:hypothetical protein
MHYFLPHRPPFSFSLKDLPNLFKSFWGKFDLLAIDISVLPINCVVDSNFHSRLVATTLFPILFVCGIAVVWLIQRQRLLSKSGENLQASLSLLSSQSIRFCVMFLFTVFPMVARLSTLIITAMLKNPCSHIFFCPALASCAISSMAIAMH